MDFDTVFSKFCTDLHSSSVDVKAVSELFGCHTEDTQRVQHVLELDEKLNSILLNCSQLAEEEQEKSRKSLNLSNELRLKGNDYYAKKLNTEAISCYNKCLALAEGEAVALAYANRSAVFYDTGDWLRSLRDIRLALDHDYPGRLEPKWREREGNCWLKLNEVSRAKASFSRARELLSTSTQNGPDKLASLVSKMEKLGKIEIDEEKIEVSDSLINVQSIEREMNNRTRRMPPVLDGQINRLMPSASRSVELRDLEGRGRCLFATEDLKPGTTVIVEKAFASILAEEFKESHCHHCLHWTPGPVPCHQCSQVGYCSTVCRDQSWSTYHRRECGLVDLLRRSGVGHNPLLALRTVLQVDRDTLQSPPPHRDIYDSTDYGTIHRLVGNSTCRSVADLFRRAVMAVFLTAIVQPGPNDQLLMATNLLRLIQSYPCNAHEITQVAIPAESGIPVTGIVQHEIGAAAMPVLSLINHSCDPNIVRVSYGDVIAVKVIRRIKSGDEILDNYGYHYATHTRHERQTKLNRQYYFRCGCPPCLLDWPQYDQIPRLMNRPDICNNLTSDLNEFCHDESLNLNDADQMKYWAVKFEEHLNRMDDDPAIQLPVRDYNDAQEALKQCYKLMATLSRH